MAILAKTSICALLASIRVPFPPCPGLSPDSWSHLMSSDDSFDLFILEPIPRCMIENPFDHPFLPLSRPCARRSQHRASPGRPRTAMSPRLNRAAPRGDNRLPRFRGAGQLRLRGPGRGRSSRRSADWNLLLCSSQVRPRSPACSTGDVRRIGGLPLHRQRGPAPSDLW